MELKLTEKETWALLKELDSFCYICKKRIILFCGTPEVKLGGCCCGYYLNSTFWMTPRYAHYGCFSAHLEKSGIRKKTILEEIDTIKILKEIMLDDLEHNQGLLKNEPICKNKWRVEVKREVKNIQKKIAYLDALKKKWE